MNEKWNQYFFGEPTEEEKRELFQELEKNEDMKREFAEMQNIVGLSGLLPREDDSLKGAFFAHLMEVRQSQLLLSSNIPSSWKISSSKMDFLRSQAHSPYFKQDNR